MTYMSFRGITLKNEGKLWGKRKGLLGQGQEGRMGREWIWSKYMLSMYENVIFYDSEQCRHDEWEWFTHAEKLEI